MMAITTSSSTSVNAERARVVADLNKGGLRERVELDLLSGERTPGRVTTQEKVFTTWKSFYAGLDEQGRVAPYLTGFSTMGTVDDADGNRVLDQEFPVTANGLSGLTMIHHQLHSTRPPARPWPESCVGSGTTGCEQWQTARTQTKIAA